MMFEKSVTKPEYSSLIFIRRFMHSSIAGLMNKKIYLCTFYADSDFSLFLMKNLELVIMEKKNTLMT